MPFSDSFRKITVKQGILSAECRKADNKTWISSSINLDEFLGNVDGKFVLGSKGFSQSAQDITLVNGVLSAKLKNSVGKYVDAKLDLSSYVHSQDGIIAARGTGSVLGVAAAGSVERTLSAASAASATSVASAASMASMSSSTSTSTSMTSVSHASSQSSKTFKSSSFRQFSLQLLIEEHCTNFTLKGAILHLDIHHEDGRVTHATFDLETCVGNVEGRLVWDASGFSKTTKDIALVDGFFLTAKCRHHINHDQWIIARLDLRTRLRVQGDIIIFVETNKKLSMMLSEVPWMKFKVIAEPDLSVFSKHPVVQQTMTRIAESTVEHVTTEMHKMLTIAMETAIVAITASAMKHVSTQMALTVQDAVGYSVASPSATESEFLHIGAAAGFYGGALGAGGAAYAAGGAAYGAGGAVYGAGSGAAYGTVGGAAYGADGVYGAGGAYGVSGGAVHGAGGSYYGASGAAYANGGGLISGGSYSSESSGKFQAGGYSNGNGHASAGGILSRSVSESSSISSSASETHTESSSVSASSSSTKTASATIAAATSS